MNVLGNILLRWNFFMDTNVNINKSQRLQGHMNFKVIYELL